MSQENLGTNLTSDAQSVLKELTPLRRELEIGGIWYVRTILPYRTANNRIEGIVVTYNDVTELKRAEEQFRTLADSIPNLAWWANGDGYITWYNRRWYDYTGTSPEQMDGWGCQSVHDPKVLPKVLERWKTSIATGEPFDMELPLRGSDGVFQPFLTRVMPLKNSTGLVLRWFGTNTDISASKQAEEAQGRLAAIVESADDAIIGKDLNGIIQTWNVGAENMFGYKAEEVIGQPISLLVPPRHTDEVPEILERIKQGEHIENFETERMRKDGTIIPVFSHKGRKWESNRHFQDRA
jgi:PAS domain S-box-containing protein